MSPFIVPPKVISIEISSLPGLGFFMILLRYDRLSPSKLRVSLSSLIRGKPAVKSEIIGFAVNKDIIKIGAC